MTQSHPRFDALRPSAPIEYGPPALQASHEAPEANTAGGNSAGAARPAVHDGPAAAKAPLALDGFCPVTLSKEERWQQGRREFAAVYQDRTFHMAGPEEHRRFLANPHRFAPMFGGVDPVLVVDQQRWTPGSIQYSVTYKGRIYMLSSEANLKQFHADPRRYVFEIDE